MNEKHEQAKWNVFTKTYLNDVLDKATAKPNSFIEEHINQIGSHELNELGIPFSYSKPTTLISYLMSIMRLHDNDLILDFFSGSATTADAVVRFEKDNGVNLRYLMIQIPERIDEKTEAFSKGYRTLTELGEERIRRAGQKVKAAIEKESKQLKIGEEPKAVPDIGFRVLKLDSSNFDKVEGGALIDNLVKPGRSHDDIIFKMMLKWGLELSLPMEKTEVAGYPITSIAADELICCMDEGLSIEVLEAIAALDPRRVFFLDSVLTDTIKLNAVQIFRRAGEKFGHEIELRTA